MLNQDLFDSLKAQKIVDTLMKGQKDYVDERLEKRETMKVSNGYAWTRPNHIDNAFASADLFEYKLQLAGQTWGYLEFETNTEKYMEYLNIICFSYSGSSPEIVQLLNGKYNMAYIVTKANEEDLKIF